MIRVLWLPSIDLSYFRPKTENSTEFPPPSSVLPPSYDPFDSISNPSLFVFPPTKDVESREILLHLLVVIVVIVVVVVVVKPSLVRHWLLFTLFSKNYIALKVFHGEGNITFLNIKRHVHLSP